VLHRFVPELNENAKQTEDEAFKHNELSKYNPKQIDEEKKLKGRASDD
jgi:hypothetical protein